MKYQTEVGGKKFAVLIDEDGTVQINNQVIKVDKSQSGDGITSLIIDGLVYKAVTSSGAYGIEMLINSQPLELQLLTPREALLQRYSSTSKTKGLRNLIYAPMPALVVKVEVEVGVKIEAGQGLVILEAMKMENEIKSPQSGIVKRVEVASGDTVEKGTLLIELE